MSSKIIGGTALQLQVMSREVLYLPFGFVYLFMKKVLIGRISLSLTVFICSFLSSYYIEEDIIK